jgi:hypothetical protein
VQAHLDDTGAGNATGTTPAPDPGTDPCSQLGYAGACDGATLSWCEGGTVHTYDCGQHGLTCGWQGDDVGNNCLSASNGSASDACQGVDYLGYCTDAGTLVWCEAGALRSYDCPGSGEECRYVDDTLGYNCVQSG